MDLSIIIPTLNEEARIAETLRALSPGPHEIIVQDGGSRDRTVEIALRYTDLVYSGPRGRGLQLAEGARRATGDALLFLHADTRLPKGFGAAVQRAFRDPALAAGAFRLSFHPANAWLRLVADMANLRSLLLKMPYGDQALFTRRSDYFRAGGFRALPVMEDVDFIRRMRRHGKIVLLQERVTTSPRRWEREGSLYATLRNWSLMARYLLGEAPESLARRYPPIR
jgi:rSAM/selenodomain-associated transferase 2